MKAKEKDHSDVLIDSFEYAVLHAGAVGGGARLRKSRERLFKHIADLKAEAESWKKRAAQHGCNVDGGDDDCG